VVLVFAVGASVPATPLAGAPAAKPRLLTKPSGRAGASGWSPRRLRRISAAIHSSIACSASTRRRNQIVGTIRPTGRIVVTGTAASAQAFWIADNARGRLYRLVP
jgi:hypothetical protein